VVHSTSTLSAQLTSNNSVDVVSGASMSNAMLSSSSCDSVLALWELAARSGILRSHLLPAPSTVLSSLIQLQQQGVLLAHVVATCLRVLAGFALGALAGTLLVVLTGRSTRASALLDPMLQALRSIPSLAWVPLFLLWARHSGNLQGRTHCRGRVFPGVSEPDERHPRDRSRPARGRGHVSVPRRPARALRAAAHLTYEHITHYV
jgi:hypothetical protein